MIIETTQYILIPISDDLNRQYLTTYSKNRRKSILICNAKRANLNGCIKYFMIRVQIIHLET